MQLYGLGDPINLYDPEGLGAINFLVRTIGGDKYEKFSDAEIDEAYGSDKDMLMGMSYGARNALTLGFYQDFDSPEDFARRNGARADTAAFAASAAASWTIFIE